MSTSGFKRSRAVFEDLLYQTLRQPGAQSSQQTQLPTGLQLGTGVRSVAIIDQDGAPVKGLLNAAVLKPDNSAQTFVHANLPDASPVSSAVG